MSQNEYKPGQVYEYNYGYSMTLFKYVKIVKVSETSVFYQEYEKTTDYQLTTDGGRPWVRPDFDKPVGKVRRASYTKYLGHIWDGKPSQEDHYD